MGGWIVVYIIIGLIAINIIDMGRKRDRNE
jgi:hypothetical protein